MTKEEEQEALWTLIITLIWIIILMINWRFGIGLGIVWHLAEIKDELKDIKTLIK